MEDAKERGNRKPSLNKGESLCHRLAKSPLVGLVSTSLGCPGSVSLLAGKLVPGIPGRWLEETTDAAPSASPDWDGGIPSFLHCPCPVRPPNNTGANGGKAWATG